MASGHEPSEQKYWLLTHRTSAYNVVSSLVLQTSGRSETTLMCGDVPRALLANLKLFDFSLATSLPLWHSAMLGCGILMPSEMYSRVAN